MSTFALNSSVTYNGLFEKAVPRSLDELKSLPASVKVIVIMRPVTNTELKKMAIVTRVCEPAGPQHMGILHLEQRNCSQSALEGTVYHFTDQSHGKKNAVFSTCTLTSFIQKAEHPRDVKFFLPEDFGSDQQVFI
jgi:hypothetical protein